MTLHKEDRITNEEVLQTLAHTWGTIKTAFNRVAGSEGLTGAQYGLLWVLEHNRGLPLSQVEIGEILSVSRSDVTTLVHRLEREELVTRLKGRDQRKKRVAITRSGLAVLERLRPKAGEFCESVLSSLKPNEKLKLNSLLKKIQTSPPLQEINTFRGKDSLMLNKRSKIK